MQGFGDTDDAAARLANDRALRRFALVLGAAVAFALSFPQILFAATFGAFLSLAAGIVGCAALLGRDYVWSDHFTRWDTAAGLYALSLLAGFFIDAEAIRLFLLEHAAQAMP